MDKEKSDLCPKHKKKFEMYCVDDKTKICMDCLWEHTKHKHEVMSLADYRQEVVLKKVDRISSLVEENYSKINTESKRFRIESKDILESTANLRVIITALLENIKLLENILPTISRNKEMDWSLKLKNRLSALKEDPSISEDDLEKNITRIEEHILFLLNYGDAYARLKENFLLLQKNIIENSSLSQLLSICINFSKNFSKWSLDSANASKAFKFSNSNFTVEKICCDDNYSSVIGTEEFSEGKHTWTVRIDNLYMNPSLKNHWINIGIIEKKDFGVYNGEHYSRSYSVSTCSQKYKVEGDCTHIIPGDILTIDLDCDVGILHIQGRGINCKAEGLKGKVFVPILELYKVENKCTINVVE